MNNLVIDIGNSNIVFGIYEKGICKNSYRISTNILKSEDEYYSIVSTLIGKNIKLNLVAISSVVPILTDIFRKLIKKILFN